MSAIGNLANAASKTFDLSYLPQFFQIGEPDNTDTISSLNIAARGVNIIQLSNAAQIATLFKLENEILAAGANTTIAKRLMLSDGRIEGQSTITALNGGATTTECYANSLGKSKDMMARRVAVTPVVASGNVVFEGFDVIFMLPANVARYQVEYMNGWSEELTKEEMQGLYAAEMNSETDGLVNGFVVVAGLRGESGAKVKRITVYATSGGNVDVVVCGWQKI